MSQPALQQHKDRNKRQESLEAAFAFFNETSSQLADSYRALESKVHDLSEELDQSEAGRVAETRKNSALELRMQALLDFLPGGVVVLDARGSVVQSNPAANDLLGSNPEGKMWRKVISDSFAPQNDDGLEVSTITGKRVSVSTSSLGQDGQIILLTDQTETRKLQAHLSRNERLSAMGKMVSALAHQIRTPLSAATLYAGHLCDETLEPPLQQKFAKKCLQRLQHMEKQVRDMMLFVKSELPLNDILSAQELESELVAASEVALQSANAVCKWENKAGQYSIKCHREALVSSIMNLINNAIQSADRQVNIRIQFSVDDQNLCVSVKDNGDGMNADTLSSVQEMFTTTKSQGTGLGLAVMRSVAKAHGAQFELSSKAKRGTQATLTIPIIVSA